MVDSAVMVIFGGTGDLTHRKLMPALYNLVYDGLLPQHFAIVSLGRKQKSRDEYRAEVLESLNRFSRNKLDEANWLKFNDILYYEQFDFTDPSGYNQLKDYLEQLDFQYGTQGNRIFYLAVAPDYFEPIVSSLDATQMAKREGSWIRLVIEKPFGKDLATARRLNSKLLSVFDEDSIYRIDHYLGKDMIQNIMVLRFCNFVFESVWNSNFIDNIQISLNEQQGVGSRGSYYEHAGAMRDMVQNHVVQILSLVAMEPPENLCTDCIRSQKLKVLQAIEEFTPDQMRDNIVFGQYGQGIIDGNIVKGYKEEQNVSPTSNTETFVALKVHINNARWAGTPFYIRTGKRVASSSAEIVIQFKQLPQIYYNKGSQKREPNILVIKIQPNVGVFFQFNTKDFSTHHEIVATKMDTSTANPASGNTPESYERLINDILRSDATLFSRWDEVEASWMFADRIIKFKEGKEQNFPNYMAGTTGPLQASELLAQNGHHWWNF